VATEIKRKTVEESSGGSLDEPAIEMLDSIHQLEKIEHFRKQY
jgi:hypothetical protein